jgi:Na+-translocating ferredoxin:NAD+ oxidoreductase RnfG subunit
MKKSKKIILLTVFSLASLAFNNIVNAYVNVTITKENAQYIKDFKNINV